MSWVLNTLYKNHHGIYLKNLESHSFKFLLNNRGGFNKFNYKERRYQCSKCKVLFSYMREQSGLIGRGRDKIIHSFTFYEITGRFILDKSCSQIMMEKACL